MRLIDADALDDVLETLYSIPIIDAEPVRHGKWIEYEPLPSEWQYKCNQCGCPSKSNRHNYCPKCGARMEGGTE